MKIAVGYLRTSGEINPKTSIPNQRKAVEDYCSEYAYSLRKIYVDDCKTGTKVEGRDGYAELLSTLEKEHISTVVVMNFDRLSRQSFEFVRTITELKQRGIGVISIQQHLNTLQMNSVQIVMAGLQAEIDNKNRIERLRDGRDYVRRQGKYNNHNLPFGYQLNEKRYLIIDAQESTIVKDIFMEFLKNQNISELTNLINERYKSLDRKLKYNKVRKILTSGVYIGKDCEAVVDADTEKCIFQLISKMEHEPIISEEMFVKVYALLMERYKRVKRKVSAEERKKYLANNMIFCAECRTAIKAIKGNSGKYRCKCIESFYGVEETHALWINGLDEQIRNMNRKNDQKEIKLLLEKKEKSDIQFATCKISRAKYEENIQKVQKRIIEIEDRGIDDFCLTLKRLIRAIKGEKRTEIRKIITEHNLSFFLNSKKQNIICSNKTLP